MAIPFADELLDRLAIPTFVIGRDHVITHWNAALAKASGLASVKMVGTRNQWMPFYKRPRPTLADLLLDGCSESTLTRVYSDKLHCSNLIDGAYVAEDFFPEIGPEGEWLSFTAAPVRDCSGRTTAVIETLVSVSDRKHAELELAESEQHYRELSMLDDLTGLYNARQLRREIKRHIDLSRRYEQPMALAMLDLDFFKQINDNYGHLFGDQILRAFGDIIRSGIRNPDDAFRYGGEEFVILMPFTTEADALGVAERIRITLKHARFLTDDGDSIQLTVSGGITRIDPDDHYDSLMQRADSTLYAAKQQGRDRILLTPQSSQTPMSSG